MMNYTFHLVESLGNGERNHHALFLQLSENDATGQQFQVTGDIQNGMIYESNANTRPESSPTFLGMTKLGTISPSNLHRIDDICRSNPPPAKQFNGPRRTDPKRPLRRCQEWTAETIRLLQEQRVLESEGHHYEAAFKPGSSSQSSQPSASQPQA